MTQGLVTSSPQTSSPQTSSPVVIDTNIVLDIWVYQDPATPPLINALEEGKLQWLATVPMGEELLRVLDYPHIAQRRNRDGVSAEAVLAHFDRLAKIQAISPKAPYICKDEDDQKFIDLAVAHHALLLSKDKQVLRLTNRLARLGVAVRQKWVLCDS